MHALLKKYNTRENGFTLIELLIVVLIIGILAAIVIPVYLGIQNQAHKTAVRADTNITVKQVQVALTEGATTSSQFGTKNGSDRGETVQVKASTTTGASTNDFMVIGTETRTTGAIDYTYTYDSVTGQFTESSGTAFGGGNQANTAPSITSSAPTTTATVGTAYTYTVTATGTPSPAYGATGLPTGLTLNATSGIISGTPTATGSYTYTITVQNGTAPNATQTGTITVAAPPAINANLEPGNAYNSYFKNDYNPAVTQTPTAAQAHTGQYSVLVPSSQYGGNQIKFAPDTALTYGTAYTVSMWVYMQNATGTVAFTTVNSNNSAYDDVNIPFNSTTAGKWTQYTLQIRPADSSAYIRLYSSGTSTIYVDDLTFTAN